MANIQQILYIPSSVHYKLIGQGGSTVSRLQTDHNVRIRIPNKEENSTQVLISGPSNDVLAVRKEIDYILGFQASTEPLVTAKLNVPKHSWGTVIGHGGATLRDLESKTGAVIHIPQKGDEHTPFQVEGNDASIKKAVEELERLLQQKLQILDSVAHHDAPVKLDLSKPISESLFFPESHDKSGSNFHRFLSYLSSASKSLDICVFTITDDRISGTILDAHAAGIKVRVITDDETAKDLGSDIDKMKKAGIPVKTDHTHAHMHHKFCVIDQTVILNGSFNWTRQASLLNNENVMVTNNKEFVESFIKEYERMWNDKENFIDYK